MILKWIVAFLLLTADNNLLAQKITINGTDGNRPLQWTDFTGKPDNSNPHSALTGVMINYSFSGVQFNGSRATLNGFEAALQLDQKNSWLKKGKESDELLKHEQGHFDISILCLQELLKKVFQTSFSRDNYKMELQNISNETFKKYADMNVQYDKETNHSINKEEQLKWNAFISKQLQY